MAHRVVFAMFSALSLIALPAAAEERASAQMVSVRYADLDPSQTNDATTLLARLRRAADATCTPADAVRGNARLDLSVEACKTETLDRVVAALDQPELTRLYAAERR